MRERRANRGLVAINLILWILVLIEVVFLLVSIYAGPIFFKQGSNKDGNKEGSSPSETTLVVHIVTWTNDDGTILEVDHDVKPTDTPSFDGTTPQKSDSGLAYYTFAGWDKELAPVNQDTTFVATYTTAHHDAKVVFDLNGNGDDIAPIAVTYGGHITKPTDPTTEHYNFASWCLDPTGTTEWNFASDTVTSDITLYAKWEPKLYTVHFDLNLQYTTQVIADQTVPYGGLITAPVVDPDTIMIDTYSGYYFDRWEDNDGKAWDFAHNIVEGDMTLYGLWGQIK